MGRWRKAAFCIVLSRRLCEGDLRLHPIVGSLVDKETLEKLGAQKRRILMPWMLKSELDDMSARHHWELISANGESIMFPALSNWRLAVTPDDLPLHLKLMADGPDNLYDMMQGPGSSWLVSARLKTLFESIDDQSGSYFPVVLHLGHETMEDSHFWHRMTDVVSGGIDVGQSDVKPVKVAGQVAFYSTPHTPNIVWNAEAVAGRHVWTDEFLRERLFVSDRALEEMVGAEMTGFKKVASPFA